jgi:hypothetical protein
VVLYRCFFNKCCCRNNPVAGGYPEAGLPLHHPYRVLSQVHRGHTNGFKGHPDGNFIPWLIRCISSIYVGLALDYCGIRFLSNADSCEARIPSYITSKLLPADGENGTSLHISIGTCRNIHTEQT